MGLLGISLLFVSIALLINGVGRLTKIDAKSIATINIITGIVIVFGNFIAFSRITDDALYINIASGFLFGFTYLFIAANILFKLDARPFAWFSLVVGVYASIMFVDSLLAESYSFAYLWGLWAILWLEGFFEIIFKSKKLGKVFPYLSIFESIFAAFIPAVLMLMQLW